MSAIEISVLDASGVQQEPGPLTTARTCTFTERLSRAGDVQIDGVPLTDDATDALRSLDRPKVIATGIRGAAPFVYGVGYIKDVDETPDQDTPTTLLNASGPNLLEELTWRKLPKIDLHTTGTPVGDAPAQLMAYAPAGWTLDDTTYRSSGTTTNASATVTAVTNIANWRAGDAIMGAGIPTGTTVTAVGTTTLTLSANATASATVALTRPAYLQFAGETLLDGLNKLATKQGEAWRADGYSIVWLYRMQPSSSVRAIANINGQDAAAAPEICLIRRVQRNSKTETYTRIYPTGAGNGTNLLTLSACTRTPPTGYTLGSETLVGVTRYYIAYTATDSVRRIDQDASYDDLTVAGTTALHGASAANQLYDMALLDLQDHMEAQQSYTLSIVGLTVDLLVGQTIHVEYEEYVDGRQTILIDDDLIVTEIRTQIDQSGDVADLDLTVATTARLTLSDAERYVGTLRAIATNRRHSQPAETAATAGTFTGASIRAHVTHSANQSIPNNTFTALTFDTEREDTDTIHDPATNPTRLTCRTAGAYLVGGNVVFAANATGQRVASVFLNGTNEIARVQVASAGGAIITAIPATPVRVTLAVGDYVELKVFQASGGALNVFTQANCSPEFWLVRLP